MIYDYTAQMNAIKHKINVFLRKKIFNRKSVA